MATAAIYLRVSTDEQAKHGYSLREQEQACRELAAELGAHDPIVLRDDGVTGEIIERPGIQRLITIAGSVDYVICKDPDRLSRNLLNQLLITEQIERAGAQLVFVNFKREKTPEGELFYQLRGVISEFEKRQITRRTMGGKIRKAREGGIPTNVQAYGYRQVPRGRLEIEPAEAEVVRAIYRWFIEGLNGHQPPVPPGEIARHLNRLGIRTKFGKSWSAPQVWRVLREPRYMGKWYYRRENAEGEVGNRYRRPEDRVKRQPRPRSEWIEVPIPAIVNEATWREAERMRRLASVLRASPRPYRTYLLTGFAVCGACGHNIVGHSRRRRHHGPPEDRIYYYVCQLRNWKRGCKALPYMRVEPIEEAVWSEVRKWVEEPETLGAYLEQAAAETKGAEKAEQIQAALEKLREEQKRLLRLYQKGIGPEEEIERNLQELSRQEAMLLERLATARPSPSRSLASVEAVAAECRPLLDAADMETKRAVLARLVEKVIFVPDKAAGFRLQIVPRM